MQLENKVEASISKWRDCWDAAELQPLKKINNVNRLKQLWNYIRIRRISKKCYKVLDTVSEPEEVMRVLEKDILKLAVILLGVKKSECAPIIHSTYTEATRQFVDEARTFDPNMDPESIFQALRNVWIMHSVQILHEMKPKYSSAIFAYSMLYPLTDNYLDDPNVSKTEKGQFNTLFRRRLEGCDIPLQSDRFKDVFSMVSRMESDYPRSEYEDVWKSILLIQKAQENSLKQQGALEMLSETEIQKLSFMKGGTSVLADGYLVCGTLSQKWIHFLLGYGILLQLADDLQDLYSDAEANHWTLFSTYHKNKDIDRRVQKLRNFNDLVFASFPKEETPPNKVLLKVMERAIDYLIFDATIQAQKNCGQSYMDKLEKQFPVSASQQVKLNLVWKSMSRNIQPKRVQYK